MKMGPSILAGGLLVLTLATCSRSRNVPSDILPKERMGSILYDIGVAEGAMESIYYRDSSKNKDSLLRTHLDRVMRIHGTDRAEFVRSYAFYKKNPLIFKEVVDSLQARAQRNQQKMFQGGSRRRIKPELRLEGKTP
jgi:hypothetical protein